MNTETLISLMSILFSGQLILAIWQVVKEIMDRRKQAKEAENKVNSNTTLMDDIIRRIFRTTLKSQLQQIFLELDNLDKYARPQVMLDLIELKDNMELYLKIGGNGAVHRLYATLLSKLLHNPDLVSFVDAAWIESIGAEVKAGGGTDE